MKITILLALLTLFFIPFSVLAQNFLGNGSGAVLAPSSIIGYPSNSSEYLNGSGGWTVPSGGTVNIPTQAGNPGYYNTPSAAMSGISAEINIRSYLTSNPSDPLQAALSACPQVSWAATTAHSIGDVVTDSNGDTEYVEACSGSCTTKNGSHPSWPTSAITNVGTQTVDNSGSNQVVWEMIALGGYAPSVPCSVIGDEGDIYPIPNAVLFGAGAFPVYVMDHGAQFYCTETGGAGHACLVEGNIGKFVGQAQGSPSANIDINAAGISNMDAPFESESGYLADLPINPITLKQTNFDLRNVIVSPAAGGTQHKAGIWLAGIEGQGLVDNIYESGGPASSTGLLVDDTTEAWNNIHLRNIWIGMGADTTGIDIECGTNGGSGLTLTGAIVDPSSATPTWLKINGGAGGNCKAITGDALYLEGSQSYTAPSEVLINDGQGVTLHSLHCNSGSGITNCVKITGVEADIHVDGINAGAATNAVNDTDYGFTNTSQGAFAYEPLVNGATLIGNSIPVSSTSNIVMNPLINKYTISGNATFTPTKPLGGNDGFFASAGAPVTFGFEVCQGTGGNFTEAFNNPSGGTLEWTGGAQPGYTLTQGNGDFYQCNYNGTNVYCHQTLSNVLCE